MRFASAEELGRSAGESKASYERTPAVGQQQRRDQKQEIDAQARPRNAEEQKAQEILRRAQAKQSKRQKAKSNPDRITGKGPAAFVKGTIRELKAATWPTIPELLRWCGIVILAVVLVSLLAMVIDNFLATPLIYLISDIRLGNGGFNWVNIALCVVLVITGIASVIGIYLHQGGESEGLSDTLATRLTGGSGQAQKNLDRITLVCIIIFVLCLLVMLMTFPEGTVTQR